MQRENSSDLSSAHSSLPRDIYLDCNATHPLLARVRVGLAEALLREDRAFGNPSSIHRRGQQAKKFVAELRQLLTEYLGRPDGDEFVFSSGATESINAVLRGFYAQRLQEGRRVHFIASAVEHSAVLDTLRDLSAPCTLIGVDANGQLDTATLFEVMQRELQADPLVDMLLCLQVANNETGVMFALPEILSRLWAQFGPQRLAHIKQPLKGGKWPSTPQRHFVLLDSAQALGKVDESYLRRCIHFADYAVFSGHKVGAPTGFGFLWLRNSAPYRATLTGGSQERKRRAGTFNAFSAYGLALAIRDWTEKGVAYRQNMQGLKTWLYQELEKIPGLHFHGKPHEGLCNTLNFHVEGCPEESVLMSLDLAGFYVSSGSACNSGTLKPSHVLVAMGLPLEKVLSSVRVCLGVETTQEELRDFVRCLSERVVHIRQARALSQELLAEVPLIDKAEAPSIAKKVDSEIEMEARS